MENNAWPTNPNQPNEQPLPPDPSVESRKKMYSVAFAFSLVSAVLVGISALILLIWGPQILTINVGDEIDAAVATAAARTVTIILGITFLGTMVWLIIATVLIDRYRKQIGTPNEQRHMAFAICNLIFSNLITGILLVIASSSAPNKY